MRKVTKRRFYPKGDVEKLTKHFSTSFFIVKRSSIDEGK